MRVALLLPLVAGLGCLASPSKLDWKTDLDAASTLARKTGKPLFVLSILGDIEKRC